MQQRNLGIRNSEGANPNRQPNVQPLMKRYQYPSGRFSLQTAGIIIVALTAGCSSTPNERGPQTPQSPPPASHPSSQATSNAASSRRDPTTGKELYDLLVRSGTTNGRLLVASETGSSESTTLSAADLSGHSISAFWACTSKGKGLEVTVMRGKEQVLWGGSEGCSNRWQGLTSPLLPSSAASGTLRIDHRQANTYVFCLVADDQVQS